MNAQPPYQYQYIDPRIFLALAVLLMALVYVRVYRKVYRSAEVGKLPVSYLLNICFEGLLDLKWRLNLASPTFACSDPHLRTSAAFRTTYNFALTFVLQYEKPIFIRGLPVRLTVFLPEIAHSAQPRKYFPSPSPFLIYPPAIHFLSLLTLIFSESLQLNSCCRRSTEELVLPLSPIFHLDHE